MSYDLQIFHREVKTQVETGLELDSFEHAKLESEDVEEFLERLGKYGYTLEAETPEAKTFVQGNITVTVFDTMIAFNVPYGLDDDSIFDALQDSSELIEPGNLALFNPQENEWTVS
jgi:N-acetyl-anhydromuramyl-L-alanine amidase AmpD